MELWTAFVIGFLGSFHCIGMCGPIALALPTAFNSRTSLIISRIVYNLGRVITYVFLGAILGLLGKTIAMAGFQEWLSIILGVLVFLGVILTSRIGRKILPLSISDTFFRHIKGLWGRLFSKSGIKALFTIGILNGFLPCGFVYIGLAAAASTGGVYNATLYMIMFGLGTVPVMLATSFAGKLINVSIRQFVVRLLPVGAIVLALLLIMRGMSLGIPYISPNLDKQTVEEGEPSCH